MQIIHLLPEESEDPEEKLRGVYTRSVSLGERVRCGKCGKRIPLGEYRYTKTERGKGELNITVLCSNDYFDLQLNHDNAIGWNNQTRKVAREKARRGLKRRRMNKSTVQSEQT